MTRAAAWAVIGGVVLAVFPVRAHAFCDLRATFDPKAATSLIPSHQVPAYWVVFRSPENDDPWQVWHCGDAATENGSVGGARPGSVGPTGALEVVLDEVVCFEVDVIASVPYRADIYDPNSTLLLSFTTSSPTYALPAADRIYKDYRVVLTPGSLANGDRDELRVDNMRVNYAPVPTVLSSWGSVKLIYR